MFHYLNIPVWIITGIGFLAQFFFAGRTILQWLKSEKAKRVVSPSSYWVLSVFGSYLFFIYGILRDDFSIILGQLISYYVYLWNLNAKGVWKKMGLVLQTILLATPVVAIVLLLQNAEVFVQNFFKNENIPVWLVIFGSAGQIIFTLRFVYQWAYSHYKKESSLPRGFWIISLVGSSVIIAYGIFRQDIVLILGQSFGFVAYTRNLIIGYRANRKKTANDKSSDISE
jgi:lipid-A-disaccharide synthase-like uncharacterized protein